MIKQNSKVKITKVLLRKVAKAFIKIAVADATENYGEEHDEPMGKVIARLNRAEKVKGVCHSHDFCDANMSMHAALEECGFDVSALFSECDEKDEEGPIYDLWNRAWDLAKKAQFDVKRV